VTAALRPSIWRTEGTRYLLVLAVVLLAVGLGQRSPWPADEPRFAQVAREMVETGQWLIPMRGGEPYPDKPPVFMWSIAAAYSAVGDLRWAFLIPNALSGLLTLLLVMDLGARLWSPRVGQKAAILLLAAPQFLIQAKNAQIDAMVCAWITLGMYGLVRHALLGPAWGWHALAWAAMGAGVITKGVGFLPALALLPLAVLALRGQASSRAVFRPAALLGPLVMLAVMALWLLPMWLVVRDSGDPLLMAYRDNLLFKQTAERYVDPWMHVKPWYYFLTSVIPVLWFPLPLLLLVNGRRLARNLRREPALMVMMTWVVLVVVFFSLSPGKRGVYVMPALPMLSLITARVVSFGDEPRWMRHLFRLLAGTIAMVLMGVGVAAVTQHPKVLDALRDYPVRPRDVTLLGDLLLILAATWAVILVGLWRRPSMSRWLAALSASWIIVAVAGYPLLEPLRTPARVVAEAKAALPAGGALGLLEPKEQILLFWPGRITHFGYNASRDQQARRAWQWMAAAPQRFLLVPDGDELPCFDLPAAPILGTAHRRQWRWLSRDQMTGQCPLPETPGTFVSGG
jgi:4-amino-4-deoxy-L-arabinose transferase-like glycosyltransferase